jgi:hypothetical protein
MRLTCRLSSTLPRGETWLHVAIHVLARLFALLLSALSVFLQIVCDDEGSRSAGRKCDAILVAGIYALVSGVVGNVWLLGLAVFSFVFVLELAPHGAAIDEVLVINVYILVSALVALWICFRQFCASESESRIQTPYAPVATTGETMDCEMV